MTVPTPLRQLAFAAVLALCLVLAVPASGLAATTPEYTHESKEAYEQQLDKGEIKSAEFNRKIRSLHIKTKNGDLFLYRYPKKGSKTVEDQLRAKHVHFIVLSHSAADLEVKENAPAKKHKIRYIVGGVVLLLIVIGLIVFFVRRRGMRD
jgi:nitrate reductase gamma subunit